MEKRTWILLSTFIVAYGVVVALVKSANLSVETKALIIGGHAVIYLSVVYAEVALFRQHFGRAGDWIRSLSNVGRAAKKKELYQAMGNAVGYLSEWAYLTYFDHRSPTESKNKAEIEYHNQLRKAVASKDAAFSRIIAIFPNRDTVVKREWVKQELAEVNAHENYSVRFFVAEDQKSLPLNLQIFDNFVFLVDPCRTNEDTFPRDIHFLSEEIARIWLTYYSDMWKRVEGLSLPDNYFVPESPPAAPRT